MSLKRLLLFGLVCGAAPMAPASTLDIDNSGAPGFRTDGYSSSRVQRASCRRAKVNCMALNRTKPKLALTGSEAVQEQRFGVAAPHGQQFAAGLGRAGQSGGGGQAGGGGGGGAKSDYKDLLVTDLGGGGKDDTPETDDPTIPEILPLAAVPVPAAGLLLALALSGFVVFTRPFARPRRKLA
jgi:hypothetical protein